MYGCNSMELNEATMKEIVQYWLDNKFLNQHNGSPKVGSVKGENTLGCQTFTVELISPTAQAA